MSTVHYCVTRFKETGSGDSKPRIGRPRVTDKSHDSRMKRLVMNNPAMTSYEIKHFMQSPAKHYCVSCLMKFQKKLGVQELLATTVNTRI